MIKLKDLLSEMPQISKQGKSVMANDQPLKNLEVETVIENIVIFYSEKETFFSAAGFTMVYFMDSVESAELMKSGKIPYLIIPERRRFDFNSSPITDVWRKANKEGKEHILGVIQGYVNEKEIYIDKMSVRPSYKRNSINSKMVKALEQNFSGRTTNYSGPTKDGSKFIKKITGADWKPAHGEKAEY